MKINPWAVLAGALVLLVGFAYFAMLMVQLCFIALIGFALYAAVRAQGLTVERAVYAARSFLYRHL